jgi:long-chain acyl-CoA synthetase
MNDRNLVDVLHRQALSLGPLPAFRHRRNGLYSDVTWSAYHDAARDAAAALIDAGIQPGDRVGLVAENSVAWLIADMAILSAAAINVPPHAPLTARQVQFQLSDAGVSWVFVSNRDQLHKLLQVRADLPAVRGIVVFETGLSGEGFSSFDGFLQRGRLALPRLEAELERRRAALRHDDLATIMYTSGTTGNPKGVMLTHHNLLSNATAAIVNCPYHPSDVVLNWLPFSHIYARTIDHYGASLVGGVLVALADSAETLVADLADVQPTTMASVPRLYEKVLSACSCPDEEETSRKLRDVFGPRIDWMSSGGAPLPLPVAEAYHRAGLLVLQGYGLTESSPVISFNTKTHNKLGTVGLPLPGVEVRIAQDGEILSRGPHIMKGYWNNPEATAEALRHGWLHTGDLGAIDADGYLRITGRKKELLVLSNGKKVVPSFIEGLLVADPCIEQAVVCGEGRHYLTALVVPHWTNLRRLLADEGTDLPPGTETSPPAAVYKFLQCRIAQALVDVSNAEQVRKFIILPRSLTVANDELTVSLKLRRNVVTSRYAAQIEALYREGKEDAAAPDCSAVG